MRCIKLLTRFLVAGLGINTSSTVCEFDGVISFGERLEKELEKLKVCSLIIFIIKK